MVDDGVWHCVCCWHDTAMPSALYSLYLTVAVRAEQGPPAARPIIRTVTIPAAEESCHAIVALRPFRNYAGQYSDTRCEMRNIPRQKDDTAD